MTETNQKIIDMVLKNASVNEICAYTGLSSKQLFHRLNMLKIKGFNFSRKYYSDGEICYKLDKSLASDKKVSLITKQTENEIKIMFLSDLHLCNENQRLDLLNEVYNFCIKENIHVIVNGGDLIDGLIGPDKKKYNTYEKQIEYAIKNHPFDKNILNFICLGNHDYKALETTGQNLETALANRRHDIISLGYGFGKLYIKNDELVVKHPKTTTNRDTFVERGLLICGHTHKSQSLVAGNTINISLPALCELKGFSNSNFSLPGFMVGNINFYKGHFKNGIFEQYVFIDKMYKVNELNYELIRGARLNEESIKYEEERTPYKEEQKTYIKKIQEKPKGLSQMEKFNNRYDK